MCNACNLCRLACKRHVSRTNKHNSSGQPYTPETMPPRAVPRGLIQHPDDTLSPTSESSPAKKDNNTKESGDNHRTPEQTRHILNTLAPNKNRKATL